MKFSGFWLSSYGVALLLALVVSSIITAFLLLLEKAPLSSLLVIGTLSFASVFLLVFMTLELLVFREIRAVHAYLEEICENEFQEKTHLTSGFSNPINRIREEIDVYISKKQSEIDVLKKNEEYRRDFIADISHELKTPLFSAQGFVLTLMDGAMDDKKVRKRFLKKAAKSLDALSLLVEDLLTLSSIESGQIKMYCQNFDLEELVNGIFDILESKAEKRAIRLHLLKSAEELYVYADPQRIAQVLNNLLVNAIKYGKQEGNVWVKMRTWDEEKIEVLVEDDGAGIPEEHLSRIFERFYRVEKSRSKKQGGSGLGLSIAKQIVHRHNSNISVSSELDKGTTFRFYLDQATQ